MVRRLRPGKLNRFWSYLYGKIGFWFLGWPGEAKVTLWLKLNDLLKGVSWTGLGNNRRRYLRKSKETQSLCPRFSLSFLWQWVCHRTVAGVTHTFPESHSLFCLWVFENINLFPVFSALAAQEQSGRPSAECSFYLSRQRSTIRLHLLAQPFCPWRFSLPGLLFHVSCILIPLAA